MVIALRAISIHTPTRGVTRLHFRYSLSVGHFNPHSHKGSDHETIVIKRFLLISIHTPTRGVTVSPSKKMAVRGHFNPHSHKGSDHGAAGRDYIYIDFNPHSHKGSDKMSSKSVIYPNDFNPHSHKGSDKQGFELFWIRNIISIHTPTRGVTHFSIFSISSHVFQSTLPQGE